ncbi:MAG: ABC transporter permease subunit [Clostridiales bacterium]|jgi:putative aldouronate transport system permease protein|nr:ABC transporter permease subunit [Clostridiales bacterium]
MGKRTLTWKRDFKRNGVLYLIFLIPLSYYVIFKYVPMVGLLMAFQNYRVSRGLWGSQWVGFDNFVELFTGEQFLTAVRNTCAMALLNLTIGFIAPILLGLLVCQLRSKRFSRLVQTVTYMPYFVSAVVCCSLAQEFLRDTGAITQFLSLFGFAKQNWLANNSPTFWFINTFLGIWQGAGYSAIIYIAGIHGINQELYEAAQMDGANRWNQLLHITITGITPIIIMMFTLQIGLVFVTGFDKVLLMYMPSTYEHSDVLLTYTYRMGFGSSNSFGLSTASGLLQSVIGTALLLIGNMLSKKATKQSMF